jgi:hypothetical protein
MILKGFEFRKRLLLLKQGGAIMETKELLLMLLPVIVLQIGLLIYCLFDLRKNGVRNLNKIAWVLIILFVNMFGPIAYLLIGRGDGRDAED